MFNLYEIGDDFDVFVAFETMNNRGKSLSDLELLKNRLIYLTTLYDNNEVKEDTISALRENINSTWREVYFQLGRNKNHPLNDDDFLKAHWIIYFKYSRKKGDDYIRFLLDEEFSPKKVLQKVGVNTEALEKIEEVTEIIQDDEDENDEEIILPPTSKRAKLSISDINNYVLSLKSSAVHWYNSFNPEYNVSEKEGLLLDRLNRINIGYFRPLIMASYANQKISGEQRISLFEHIERFIFLAFRLSQAKGNFRSSFYYNAAKELYYGKQTVSDIIFSMDRDLGWTKERDGAFKYSYFKGHIDKKFSSGGPGFYGWNGLRYFLFEYEEELKKSRNQPKISWKNFIQSEKDTISIEHIFPQNYLNPCWHNKFIDFKAEQISLLQGTLGNLLPLSSRINSSLQDSCFEEKKQTKTNDNGDVIRNGYSNGSYSEQEVAAYSEWTVEEIKNRGLRLLKFMEKRWSINFSSENEMLDLLHLSFLREIEVNNTDNEEKQL